MNDSEILERVKDVIKKQDNYIRAIVSQAYTYAIVISFGKRNSIPESIDIDNIIPNDKNSNKTCVIIHQGRTLEVLYNDELKLVVGDTVKCLQSKDGVGIVEKTEAVSMGATFTVKDVLADGSIEIDIQGMSKVALSGLFSGQIEKGARVILDETGTIVVKNLGKEQGQYNFTEKTGVSWNDIGGLDDVKKQMTEAIEDPINHRDLYKAYGRKPTKGILLFGPPGNGKTLIGKAVATSVSELYNTKESGFIYIKGPEILNMYVGNSEERIRGIFATAREFQKKTGCPAIIFIDEAEAILSKRGSGKSSDVDKTIVPQFLTEMDGLDESSAIVILTTNRPDMLDSAIIREGRIDKKIKVPRPNLTSVEMIFDINLKKVPCTIDYKKISKNSAKLIFDESLCLYDMKLKSGKDFKFCMQHIINGAMVSAIVNDAITTAINRDLSKKTKKPTGVTLEDVHESILKSFSQNSRMNHESHFEDLTYELTTEYNDEITDIKPAKIRTHEKEKTAVPA